MTSVIKNFDEIEHKLHHKNIVYIATKNKDYIRMKQELEILEKQDVNCIVLVSKNKNYFIRIMEVFLRVLFLSFHNVDIVYISFLPQFILPFLFWKFRKVQVWTDFFISLYDTLVFDRKIISERSLLAGIVKRIDQFTLKKSNVIICDTKIHGRYFADTLGADALSIYVLYLKADITVYYPQKAEKPKEWKDKFIVFYFGSILPLQGIEVVLQSIEILQDYKPIHFILVGPIGKKYERITCETVTYIDWLSQEQLAKYISFSDLCLAGHFSKDISKANRTIPGKAFIYRAMEKKIVLGNTEANREYYEADGEHIYYVMPGNAEALSEMIMSISKVKECDQQDYLCLA